MSVFLRGKTYVAAGNEGDGAMRRMRECTLCILLVVWDMEYEKYKAQAHLM